MLISGWVRRGGGGRFHLINLSLSPRVEEANNLDWLKLNQPTGQKTSIQLTNSFKGILDLL
jgi:hypothetical protein